MTAREAVAVAHPNIALIKYWGKRDEHLVLPFNDSLSLTLDVFPTTTKVRLEPDADADRVVMDGAIARGEVLRRTTAFLELVRELAGRRERAVVETRNTVPVGAGLASSASGFAALALAAAHAYGLSLGAAQLSRLARRGSGSAARSVFGGFVVWHAGDPDAPDPDHTSYAEPVTDARLDASLVAVVLDAGPKAVSSREAMRRTVATSPLYRGWVTDSHADLARMRTALRDGDMACVGEIAERNALGMHATMETARPAVRYLTSASTTVLDEVRRLRREGVGAWATMDAGPNVKVLCASADAEQVAARMREVTGVLVVVARSGPGARHETVTS
ncbi:diphosphomevalonate decarboxylase [Streptomyces capillispiralis]|uniref:diphosphomevalonate decarboxylase n=1 Tax=Streptomyces capillispiralis TaxID=68182 RepID=A0A561SGI4_9ACTN|nr:diphosphomevalonate decarboxylase [Streptomyces capillispiralis]TWF73985.1 diphosphomevalonate decarboxylase [Streptomyces capillispiralis]GHH96326.1 diphosphomevalonate decarboxylase [Streptomyces capillispiralis]